MGLLVVPGAWLYTRWSLSIPVICNEDIGPVESLKRSNALATGSITGSHTWGEWVGGSIVAALAIPLAALTTSLAYSRVAKLAGPVEGS
jgi:hypothetical protein